MAQEQDRRSLLRHWRLARRPDQTSEQTLLRYQLRKGLVCVELLQARTRLQSGYGWICEGRGVGRSRLDAPMRLDDDEVKPFCGEVKQSGCPADVEATEGAEASQMSLLARAKGVWDRRIWACAGGC